MSRKSMRHSLAVLVLAALASGEEPKTLVEATAMLEKALAKNVPNDATAALILIPKLWEVAEHEKEQKAAVAMVGKAAGNKDLRIRHGAFGTLGVLKVRGSSKYLTKWLNPPKRFKGEIPESYFEAFRALGSIADANTLDRLRKLADHGELEIARSATTALGGFHTLPVKRRKNLAFDLVKRLGDLTAPPGRRGWRNAEKMIARRQGLAAATVTALQRLTGKDYTAPEAWEKWMERARKQRDPFG